ncbi:hypothetical protein O3P69_009023 [Scylla paramamosain]|uniref:Prokineticin domain-containing protein n=1 Tax=Scylla paramamosain TaxID=85552 RepID=A0AAW0TST4_SCYPA
MDAFRVLCGALVVLACFNLAQGLMFKPVDGEPCSDNIDCVQGCCLMTGYRHRRPSGVCQPMTQMGEYCAPGNRLRNYYGSRVYTYSCPCGGGLTCKPRWSSKLYGRSVMEDPKCMPPSMHPYILAMTGHNYNTYHYNRHNIPSVPAE